jgi:hypothetical protein
MNAGDTAQWVMTGLIAFGLIFTWYRNGRSQRKGIQDYHLMQREQFTELKGIVNGIKDNVENENTGLGALSNKLNEMKNHCSGVTASFAERITGHDREIASLRKRRYTAKKP